MQPSFRTRNLILHSWRAVCLLAWLLAACQPAPTRPAPTATAAPEPIRTESGPNPQATRRPSPTAGAVVATPTQPLPTTSPLDFHAEELAGVEISFWHPFAGAEGEALRVQIDEFNRTNEWKIVVNALAVDGADELDERLRAAGAPASTPGPQDLSAAQGAPGAQDAPIAGLPDLTAGPLPLILEWDTFHPVVDLRRYIEDAVWGYTAQERGEFYAEFWENDILDGRRVGLPYQRFAQLLFYNVTWAGELGFAAAPSTPQQLADQACAASEALRQDATASNDGAAGLLVSPHYAAALGWIFSFEGELLDPLARPDESPYRFNTTAAERAFTFLRDLYDDRCAWATENYMNDAEFAGRRALFLSAGLADIPYQHQAMQQAGSADAWTVIAYPSPDQKPGLSAYGSSLAIFTSTSPRQLAAWLFARYLLEAPNHARLVEACGSFPISAAELPHLAAYRSRSPQWDAALALLPFTRSEPPLRSWNTARWAVSDAFIQLFRSYFTVDQLPAMLNLLERTAAEIHLGPDPSIFNTPTPSATPSASG